MIFCWSNRRSSMDSREKWEHKGYCGGCTRIGICRISKRLRRITKLVSLLRILSLAYHCLISCNRALFRPDCPLAPRCSVRYPSRTKSLWIIWPYSVVEIVCCTASRARLTSRRKVRLIPFPSLRFFIGWQSHFRRLSQTILDKVFHGIPDLGRGCLLVFYQPEANVSPHFPFADAFRGSLIWLHHFQNTCDTAIGALEHVGKVVDSLYAEVRALYFFLVVIFDFLSDITWKNLGGYNWVGIYILLYTMITLHTLLQEALKKAQKVPRNSYDFIPNYYFWSWPRGDRDWRCRRLRTILCRETHPRKFIHPGRLCPLQNHILLYFFLGSLREVEAPRTWVKQVTRLINTSYNLYTACRPTHLQWRKRARNNLATLYAILYRDIRVIDYINS
jgi:hypothetical protein